MALLRARNLWLFSQGCDDPEEIETHMRDFDERNMLAYLGRKP